MMFNCCTGGQLPNMKQFLYLEIAAVYPYPDGKGGTCCESFPGVAKGKEPLESFLPPGADKSLLFYTIYGIDNEGDTEALHDADTLEDAKSVTDLIAGEHKHLSETVVN